MTPELYTDGKALLFTQRNLPPVIDVAPAITGLGINQLQWCAANLKGFAWPRVSRLADHERASAEVR